MRRILRGAAWLRAGLAGSAFRLSSFFYFAKFEPIEETEAGRLKELRDGRFSPSGRPDLRIARVAKRQIDWTSTRHDTWHVFFLSLGTLAGTQRRH